MRKAKPKKKAVRKVNKKKTAKKGKPKKALKKAKRVIKEKTAKALKKEKAPQKIAPKKAAVKIKTPFSKKELDDFKERLINIRDDIMERIREMSEDTLMKSRTELSGDISGYSIHPADMASDNYDREFNLGLVSNERKLLLEIDEALKRIEDGTYGICLYSQKPISKSRLKVIPYTRYRKDVQEQLEKEGKL